MVSIPMRGTIRAAIVSGVVMASVATVYAMRVSPMIVEMTTTGTGATARIEVQNLNAGRLPFETRITRIAFDENGQPSETPADQDFIVFPPQGMLPQGGRQVIRVQWVGGADLPTSQAYYLSVNQLPVPVGTPGETSGAQVQLVYHMKALMVVAPPNAQPNVSVVSVKQVPFQAPAPEKGKPAPAPVPGVEVTLKNVGRRHAMMSDLKWQFSGKLSDGRAIRTTITSEGLNAAIGSGYIAGGGGVRIYRLPIGTAFGPGPIELKFAR